MSPVRVSAQTLASGLAAGIFALIFLSKVSLKPFGVPYSAGFILYQHGMHPYVNVALNFMLGLPLILLWLTSRHRERLNPYYLGFVALLSLVLVVQTLLQMILIQHGLPKELQIQGLVLSLFLILVFGVVIPQLVPLNRFVGSIRSMSVALTMLSLVMLPLFGLQLFRGGRFIGVFKHIPHMVTCSTFAVIFFLTTFMSYRPLRFSGRTALSIGVTALLTLAVVITATKAAIVTVLAALGLAFAIYGKKTLYVRLSKIFVSLTLAAFLVVFGADIYEAAARIVQGRSDFLFRPSTSGIETRLDEFYRGFATFSENPWIGKGILYRFLSESGFSVNSYNAMQDPHNYFASAGVIGGWPLLIVAIIGYVMMVIGALKGLLRHNDKMRMLGILLIAHLPVFLIYHVHISLGGMADRLYWLCFGYLALDWARSKTV